MSKHLTTVTVKENLSAHPDLPKGNFFASLSITKSTLYIKGKHIGILPPRITAVEIPIHLSQISETRKSVGGHLLYIMFDDARHHMNACIVIEPDAIPFFKKRKVLEIQKEIWRRRGRHFDEDQDTMRPRQR